MNFKMNTMANYLLLTCFILITFIENSESRFISPIGRKVKITHLRNCNMANISPFFINATKHNRTVQVFNGNGTLIKDFTDEDFLEVELQRWSDGGWKENFIHFEKGQGCSSVFFILGDAVREILIKSGRKPGCPVLKGSFVIQNALLEASHTPLAMVQGTVKLILKVKDKTKKPFICLEAVADIEEKV